MTNVQSIFGNFNEIEVKEDEGEIFDSLKDFSDEWVKFLNILIMGFNSEEKFTLHDLKDICDDKGIKYSTNTWV